MSVILFNVVLYNNMNPIINFTAYIYFSLNYTEILKPRTHVLHSLQQVAF